MFRLLSSLVLVLAVECQNPGFEIKYEDVGPLSRRTVGGTNGNYINSPGLRALPRPSWGGTLIRFVKARPSTYMSFVDALTEKLTPYENRNQQSEDGSMADCRSLDTYRPEEEWDRPCRFSLQQLGSDCVVQQAYGYEDGQPCVLLTLERTYRWLPELYTNDTIPEVAREHFADYWVTVTCEGMDAPSRDNMGNITFHPPHGFHVKYFPNLHQYRYLSPVMFVRFENPMPAVVVRVECKMWARNILHDRHFNTGVARFEILVD